MADLFDLQAKISLDSSEYEKGLEDASGKTSTFASKLGSGLKSAAKVGGVAIGAVTAATGAFAAGLISGVNNLADYGDEVDKASQKLGISAAAYQEWDAVLQHSGTSMSSMTGTFRTLSKVAQNATDDQVEALEKIGLSIDEISNLSTEDLFGAIITRLQSMEEGTERTAIATQLLGRGATEMGALLNTSAEDTQAMRDRVRELGGVLADDGVKNAAAFKDEMQDMQTAIQATGRNIVAKFLPTFTEMMKLVTDFVSSDMFQDLASNLSNIFQRVVDIMKNTLLPTFKRVWPTISRIIGDVLDLLDTIVPILDPIVRGIVWLFENILLPVIEGVFDAISTIVRLIQGDFSSAVDNLETATSKLEDAQDRLKNAQDNLVTSTDNLKSSQDNLRIAEENAKMSADELIGLIEDGTLQYDYLTDAQKDLYDAYYDNIKAAGEYTDAVNALKDAQHEEYIASLEVERALADEKGTLEDFARSVVEAFENGELSAEEAQKLIEEAMAGMSLAAEKAFLEEIPDDIRQGLDPARYETELSLFKKSFDEIWAHVKTGAEEAALWIHTNFNEPVQKWFEDTANAIGRAFSDAWNAITQAFANAGEWFYTNVIHPIAEQWGWLLDLFGAGGLISEIDAKFQKSKRGVESVARQSIPHLAGGGILARGQIGLLEGNGAEAVVPLDRNEKWINAVARSMSKSVSEHSGGASNLQIQTELLAAIRELKQMRVVMDTGQTVGALATPMNGALGDQYSFRRRGII